MHNETNKQNKQIKPRTAEQLEWYIEQNSSPKTLYNWPPQFLDLYELLKKEDVLQITQIQLL